LKYAQLRKATGLAAAIIVTIVSLTEADDAPKPPTKDEGFVRIYNGKDLSGWEVQNGKLEAWKADGDLLSCISEGGGWLRSSAVFSDFVLRIEWKIPKGGNSGVGLRFPPKGDPAHDGMEIQILDDKDEQYKSLKEAQYTGGIYYQAPAKHGVAKPPGEWNLYEITCLGPHVTIVLNGTVVNDVMVDTFKEGQGGHMALADRPEIGHVGMQSHGSRVDFRNIEIKNLTKTTSKGLQYVDIVAGTGKDVPAGAKVTVHFTGRLTNGKRFETSRDREAPVEMPLNGVIPGLQEGIVGMKVGGRRKLIIPPELGYGKRGDGKLIPADAMLIYDVEVKGLP
jgi:hypothetical protein